MIALWTPSPPTKVYSALSPVLKHHPDLKITIPDDFSIPEGTKVLLTLGKAPHVVLQQNGIIPKTRTITSTRGIQYAFKGTPTLVTYDAGVGNINHAFYVDMLTDVAASIRLFNTGSLKPKYGLYRYVEDFGEIMQKVQDKYMLTGKPVDCTLDLETVGLDPYRLPSYNHPGAYIVTCQLSCEFGKSDVVYFTGRKDEAEKLAGFIGNQIRWWCTSFMIKLKGANFKYDLHWLVRRAGIYCSNFVFDTTLVGSLLDENRSNGLDVHTKIYVSDLGGYSDEFDKTVDKARMDLVPKDKMLPYAGGDSDANLQVADVMKKDLLANPALASFYVNILHPASRAFEEIEQGGILVDLGQYECLRSDLETELNGLVFQAKKFLGGRLVAKHLDTSKVGDINIMKPSLLVDFMFSPSGLNLKPKVLTPKNKTPSSSLDHLMMFKDDPNAGPFVSLLEDYGSAAKMLNTYVGEVGVSGFLEHLRSDGRFHPSFWLFVGDKSHGEGGTVCLPAGQLVLTNRGYLPIEQVIVGDEVISHKGKARKVEETVVNGIKSIVRVTMSNGLSLLTTENHPYRIGESWVEAANLVSGMQAWAHSDVEEWAPIQGWVDFEVSSWGRVFNKKTKNFLRQYPKGEWGHLKVCLRRNGAQERGEDRKDFAVHKLVAGAFLDRFGRTEVRHLNGYAWDNTVGNLEWGTPYENKQDAVEQGTLSKRQGKQAKLTEEKVEFIRNAGQFWNNRELADKLSISRELVRDVRNGKRWPLRIYPGKIAKFKPVTVVKVEHLPPDLTYGLVVEEDHSHVTGGIVTHNTGRLSAQDPAFQTLVKHNKWAKALRRCFPAPPGYVVVERDYSQGELRIIAVIACESSMIEVYKQGKDLHVETSANFAGYTYEGMMELQKTDEHKFDEIRQLGKVGNFGLVYGIGVDGFKEYARVTYGVILTWDQANDFRNAFFVKYKQLLEYHRIYKKHARDFGWVASPLGRIRHLPLINSMFKDLQARAERQAINSPVQSALSDMLIWAIAIEHQTGLSSKAPSFGTCHDAGYNYMLEDRVDVDLPLMIENMENLPFEKVGWAPTLKFLADAKVGKNMGDVKKYLLKAA